MNLVGMVKLTSDLSFEVLIEVFLQVLIANLDCGELGVFERSDGVDNLDLFLDVPRGDFRFRGFARRWKWWRWWWKGWLGWWSWWRRVGLQDLVEAQAAQSNQQN
jgi:hypothetical protein